MGVKDLWQILAPVCERKSLWDLEGQSLAIDLSGWICDSQNVVEFSSQPNMYLRNLFFRTSCLLLLGARPVFVLEGIAPDLKLDVMSQRNSARGHSTSAKQCGSRKHFKSVQKKCREMLKCLGVSCVESSGEAEALCAALNAKGLVDGCVTQDSDCFLYGGRVIYRNFTISNSGGTGGPGFSVDMYRMDQIEKVLGLSRTKLIGLSLLCGCDYNRGGVAGVGKETAVKFVSSFQDDEIFSRFRRWRTDVLFENLEKERTLGLCPRCGHYGKQRQHDRSGCSECGTNKKCFENVVCGTLSEKESEEYKSTINELNMRKKALQDPNFPSQDIIDEFLHPKENTMKNFSCEWSEPNLVEFLKFAEKKLNWEDSYSLEKFLPVLTRWILLCQTSRRLKCPVYPKIIHKARVLKGVASYEVKWEDSAGLFETIRECDSPCVTIEPQDLFQRAFPELTKAFTDEKLAEKGAKKKGKKKATAKKIDHLCEKCGKEISHRSQKCMCLFLVPLKPAPQREKTLEEMLDDLTLNKKKGVSQSEVKHLQPILNSNNSVECSSTFERLEEELRDNERLCEGPVSEDDGLLSSVIEDKFSFEDFLQGEKFCAADFLDLKDLNLSDVVQSITGKPLPATNYCEEKKSVIGSNVSLSEHFKGSMCVETTRGGRDLIEPNSDEKARDNADNNLHSQIFCISSSDDECPYTPLVERVRLMREKNVSEKRRSRVHPSIPAKRFSESFYSFCADAKTISSSPKRIEVSEKESSVVGEIGVVDFSLGISAFLQSSNT